MFKAPAPPAVTPPPVMPNPTDPANLAASAAKLAKGNAFGRTSTMLTTAGRTAAGGGTAPTGTIAGGAAPSAPAYSAATLGGR